jgi:hypothetical protein
MLGNEGGESIRSVEKTNPKGRGNLRGSSIGCEPRFMKRKS